VPICSSPTFTIPYNVETHKSFQIDVIHVDRQYTKGLIVQGS